MASASQPLLNLKTSQNGVGYGNYTLNNKINSGNNATQLINNGLSVVSQVKQQMNQIDEGVAPRRKRFVE